MGVHIAELNLGGGGGGGGGARPGRGGGGVQRGGGGGGGGGGGMEPLQESLGRGVPYKILTSDKNCLFHYPV